MIKRIREHVSFFIGLLGMLLISTAWIAGHFIWVEKTAKLKSTISSQAYEIMDLRNRLGDVYGTTIHGGTKWQSIEVTATAYSARREETDNTPHETSTGELTICGIIAVSPDLVALGMVPGKIVLLSAPSGTPIGAFRIADRMNSRHRNRIDLLAGNTLAATLYGQRRVVVTWPNY